MVADETGLLGQLADCLGYLGRSESWVEAELVPEGNGRPNGFDALPHQAGLCPGPKWEQVTVMAAFPPGDYSEWRTCAAAKVLAEFPLPEGKKKPSAKLLKDRTKAEAPFPTDLLDCLIKDTAWWKEHRWSQPPGSQRVVYWRRAGALEVGVPKRSTRRPARSVTTMLLALTTRSWRRGAFRRRWCVRWCRKSRRRCGVSFGRGERAS